MSTAKVINVQHPSASTTNIVNDASGNVAVGNNLTVAGSSTITGNETVTGTLTVGGVAAVAVAPGTSGNVLKSNGTIWQSAAPTASASLTLLATLTTTSGTTQSATGLPTTYNNLVIVASGINSTAGSAYEVATSANNGSSYGAAASFGTFTNSAFSAASTIIAGANLNVAIRSFVYGYGGTITSSTSGPINALRFSMGGNAFTAGTIYIYGWN